jgi:hypothetical protein
MSDTEANPTESEDPNTVEVETEELVLTEAVSPSKKKRKL